VSDQNQWPKPGESTPDGAASANQPAPDQGAPSSAAQPDSGASQQYGASGPEAPSAGSDNPYAAPQNPYAAPTQQGGQPGYGAPQGGQPGYGAPQGGQPGYGAPQGGQPGSRAPQNPYAAPRNPYAAPQAPNANQYGNQYGAPQASNPYAAPAYSAAGYQPYAQRPKTNTLAILSIVFGLGAIPFWFMAILLGPAGAILGHVALGKIKQTGESGRGLALTGIIAGWVMAGVWILWIVVIVVFAGLGHTYSDNYDYDSGAFIG